MQVMEPAAMSRKHCCTAVPAAMWFTLAVLLCLSWQPCPLSAAQAGPAAQPKPVGGSIKVAVYDPDPQHLWNRLYRVLYLRIAPEDGKIYGLDELDPLIWP